MVYSLCALASFMAEIYFMVNYKKEYVIIAAVGLVFLVSVGFLLDEIFDAVIKPPVSNNMDELLKVQKAAYLQGKNLTEELNRLIEEGIDSITQTLEENKNAIIDNEKTVAKVVMKRNGENSERIREAVEAIDLSKIPVPEITMPEIAMPEINIPEIRMPEMPVASGNNSEEIELAKKEIISLIDKLSEQVKNSARMEDIVELKEMLSKKLENVSVADVSELVEEATVAEEFDINAENTFDDLFKDLENVIPEESVAEMPVVEEPAPAISLPTMDDDPNKQLSADEIAALFASIQ